MTYRIQNFTQLQIHVEPRETPVVPTQKNTNYGSYSQRSRSIKSKNVLLNDLQVDTGYPQPILLKRIPKQVNKNNYLRINIKKMAEYNPRDVKLGKLNGLKLQKQPCDDPRNILFFKKMEIEGKQQTRMNLKNQPLRLSINKFHIQNDPRKLSSKLFTKKQIKNEQRPKTSRPKTALVQPENKNRNSSINFKTYTESFMMKRSITRKKMVYYRVFGQQQQAKSIIKQSQKKILGQQKSNTYKNNTLNITVNNFYNQNINLKKNRPYQPEQQLFIVPSQNNLLLTHLPPSNSLDKKVFSHRESNKKDILKNERKKFTELVSKLSYYDQIFIGNIQEDILKKQINQKIQRQNIQQLAKQKREKQLMINVKRLTQNDQQYRFSRNYQHIKNIQDIEKIDPKFLKEWENHKKKKIQFMKQQIKQTNQINPHYYEDSIETPKSKLPIPQSIPSSSLVKNAIPYFISKSLTIQQQTSGILRQSLFLSRPVLATKNYGIKQLMMERYQKLRYFLRNLFQVRDQALRFGIPLQYLYTGVFEQNKTSYKVQGSYIFYRAIYANDIKTIQVFIQECPLILYQIDEEGRTPLLIATRYNLIELSLLFIKKGVNLQAISYKGRTPLYYAVKNNNIRLVTQLLMNGVSPWSTKYYQLKSFIKDVRIQTLLKNARKVSIALKITKIGKRQQLWSNIKHLIIEQQQHISSIHFKQN